MLTTTQNTRARTHRTYHMLCSRRISCKYDISSCALRAGAARCAALMRCMQLKPVMCHRRRREAVQAKAAQLLTQWLALPTTETLLRLIFSNARRSPPISRDVALERNAGGPLIAADRTRSRERSGARSGRGGRAASRRDAHGRALGELDQEVALRRRRRARAEHGGRRGSYDDVPAATHLRRDVTGGDSPDLIHAQKGARC